MTFKEKIEKEISNNRNYFHFFYFLYLQTLPLKNDKKKKERKFLGTKRNCCAKKIDGRKKKTFRKKAKRMRNKWHEGNFTFFVNKYQIARGKAPCG